MKNIVIDFDDDGTAQLEVNGCKGPECESLSAGLRKAIGTEKKNDPKPEFFQDATQAAGANQS